MGSVALQKYFQVPACQRAALEGSRNQGGLWPVGNLDLYDQSFGAFYDPTINNPVTRFDDIYRELAGRNWSVFRPQPISACWGSTTMFNAIRSGFQAYGWGTSLTLMNFGAQNRQKLELCLPLLRGVKPNKGYPIMTVSKFLHFYNPGLFPIYDTEMVWKRALGGTFRNEYRAFGQRWGVSSKVWSSEDTLQFLPWYMCFANELLSASHPASHEAVRRVAGRAARSESCHRGDSTPRGFTRWPLNIPYWALPLCRTGSDSRVGAGSGPGATRPDAAADAKSRRPSSRRRVSESDASCDVGGTLH